MTENTNLTVNVDEIIDKIKRAAAGENVQGVSVVTLPRNPETTKSASLPVITMLLLGALAFIILKPSKRNP